MNMNLQAPESAALKQLAKTYLTSTQMGAFFISFGSEKKITL